MKIAVIGVGAVGFFLCKYLLEKTDFAIKCADKSIRNLKKNLNNLETLKD